MKRSIKRIYLALVIILVPQVVVSQSMNPEELFNQGLILYRNGNFEQAKLNFIKLAALKENNPRETVGILMLAKSHLQLEEYDEAIQFASLLINDYPTSGYIPHAYYVRAGAYFYKKAFDKSLDDFTYAIEFATSTELSRLAESTATTLVDNSISLKKIESLLQSYPWFNAKPILTIWQAHLKYKEGQLEEANQILEKFIASKPEARYATIAHQLMKKDIDSDRTRVRIGVLQPLSGYFSKEAQDLLRGFAFALKRRRAGGPEIGLVVKDTRGDIVETIKVTSEIANSDVELVITDVEGVRSATIAGLLKSSDIPIVVPVSTDNNLTKISDFVFQFNNDTEKRGAALADYAMNKLGMKTFATLAPADDYGNAITDAFTNQVDLLGGTIVSQQWYYPGTTDFSGQLETIREAGFRYTYRDSLRSWGRNSNMAQVDSMYAIFDKRARRNSQDSENLAEFTDISVRSIDGFFIPIYEEDIPYIVSQFALYNIKSRLLGGDTWNSAELLQRHQRYVNGLVYVAGYYISETDLDYINFTRDFRMATSTSPGVMALYGYNVMNLIIEAVDAGNTTGQEIFNYLKKADDFEGLGTRISLNNSRRVNDYVNILQFQDGLIYRMNETE